jgi:hypothetical protein
MKHVPEFKGSIEGYVVNYLRRHLWRIAATHDHADAMQEAYAVFLRTAAHYPMVETPQHFMALFKTSWNNEFNDLSVKASVVRLSQNELAYADTEEDGGSEMDVLGDLDNDGALATMVRQAPSEVVMVLNLFLNAPQELLDLAMSTWRKNGKYRADGDKAVSQMLGLKPGSTPMSDTQNYFS